MRERIQALFVEFFELHCISQSQIWHVDEKTTGLAPQQLPSTFLCLDGWMDGVCNLVSSCFISEELPMGLNVLNSREGSACIHH